MTPLQLINISYRRPLIIVVVDGMHEPGVARLGGATPWGYAGCTYMGQMGRDEICLVPEGLEAGTDVALLTLLGYDARGFAYCRAPLEALGVGVDVADDDMVVRCNLVKMCGGRIVSHCGDDVDDAEAACIVRLLNDKFGAEGLRFYPGGGFRCLLKIKGVTVLPKSTPPHNILNKGYADYLIGDRRLAEINLAAVELLADKGLKANGIWLWEPGRLRCPEPFLLKAASISGVPLVRGISRAVGIKVVDVDGATGLADTNLKSKCAAAIDAASCCQLVLVHIEACDEASHRCDVEGKINMIRRVDNELVAPLLEYSKNNGAALVVLSDHATSSVTGRHLPIPVPCYTYNID